MNLSKPPQLKCTTIALILTGLALFVAIYLATTKLFSTYVDLENNRAGSFWSVIQLQKELDAMYYQSKLYQNNSIDHDTLKLHYELLWSRFPIVQNMLKKDEILLQIAGLKADIDLMFTHVRAMEDTIIRNQRPGTAKMDQWAQTLAVDRQRLNNYVVHNMSGSDDDYVAMAANKLLAYLITIALLIVALLLYLGVLLYTLIQQQKRNRFLLAHDSLTGLKGRFYTLKAISKRCQQKKPFTLINFDLNKFKQINDNYGHHTGDQVLLHISDIFKKTLAPHGVMGRVGGDEFLWVTDLTDKDAINQLHDQLLAHLQRAFMTENNKIIRLQVSAGAGLAADYNFNENLLKDEVDKAMYCAKSSKMPGICWQDSLKAPAEHTQNHTPATNTPSGLPPRHPPAFRLS